MSSRALRKAQKEKEEQERLQLLEKDADSGEEEVVRDTHKPKISAFALLGDDDDDNEDEEAQDIEGDENETDGQDGVVLPSQDSLEIRTPPKSKKKKTKKKKAKAATAQQEEEDDIDKALQELAIKQNAQSSGTTAAGADTAFDEACKLLAVDKDNLHVQNEMKKLFGRAALDNDDEDAPVPEFNNAGLDRRQRRQLQHNPGQRGRLHGAGSLALRRNVFIQGKEEWPLTAGGGLGMEVTEKRDNGEIEYRFVHHRVYQETQQEFEICVASMDPNRLVNLLQQHPTHISTLLQVSELMKSERGHAMSGEALERALFVMGRAVHSTFAKHLAEGKARLDFRRPENRELWLAGWRYMQNLSMRGTWRTVYEWAKLLLSLSPEDDPYAMWLCIDQYALRSKQDLDYLNLSRNAVFQKIHGDLPSIRLSQGLAEYRSGNKSKGRQALYAALCCYPWFTARLIQELGMDAPPGIWGKQPRNDKESLHAALYAVRAKDIWNTPEHSALLIEIASAVPADFGQLSELQGEITLNEARHVILADIPQLIELVPREYTAMYTSASDPLPPPDSIESYKTEARSNRRGHGLSVQDVEGLLGMFREQGILPHEGQEDEEDIHPEQMT